MSILESMALLVYSYVTSADRIKCVSVGEKASPTSPSPSCFRGLFGPVLGSESVKQDRPASWESLLVTVLKLLGKLVRTPLPSSGEQQVSGEKTGFCLEFARFANYVLMFHGKFFCS